MELVLLFWDFPLCLWPPRLLPPPPDFGCKQEERTKTFDPESRLFYITTQQQLICITTQTSNIQVKHDHLHYPIHAPAVWMDPMLPCSLCCPPLLEGPPRPLPSEASHASRSKGRECEGVRWGGVVGRQIES